jgi:hypothetical protein
MGARRRYAARLSYRRHYFHYCFLVRSRCCDARCARASRFVVGGSANFNWLRARSGLGRGRRLTAPCRAIAYGWRCSHYLLFGLASLLRRPECARRPLFLNGGLTNFENDVSHGTCRLGQRWAVPNAPGYWVARFNHYWLLLIAVAAVLGCGLGRPCEFAHHYQPRSAPTSSLGARCRCAFFPRSFHSNCLGVWEAGASVAVRGAAPRPRAWR